MALGIVGTRAANNWVAELVETREIHANETRSDSFGLDTAVRDPTPNSLCVHAVVIGGFLDCAP